MRLYEDQIKIYLEVIYLFIHFCAQKNCSGTTCCKIIGGKKIPYFATILTYNANLMRTDQGPVPNGTLDVHLWFCKGCCMHVSDVGFPNWHLNVSEECSQAPNLWPLQVLDVHVCKGLGWHLWQNQKGQGLAEWSCCTSSCGNNIQLQGSLEKHSKNGTKIQSTAVFSWNEHSGSKTPTTCIPFHTNYVYSAVLID